MTKNELIVYIKGFITAYYENQKDFAQKNDLSPAYVSDVLSGRRDPGDKILNAVNTERVVTYKLKNSDD